MAYEPGDIFLATIVFPDASGVKKRPVLVVYDSGDADLLVVPITSHPPRSSDDVALPDWQQAGLRLPSTGRMSKLATIAKASVTRKLGHLTQRDEQATRTTLHRFLQSIIGHG